MPKTFRIDLDLEADRVHQLISDRSGAQRVFPDLVPASNVLAPSLYKRFSDSKGKDVFREKMLHTLRIGWVERYGTAKTDKLMTSFTNLAANLDYNGALIFGSILDTRSFEKLIVRYSRILTESGSRSWIHSYVNLANHPDFSRTRASTRHFFILS